MRFSAASLAVSALLLAGCSAPAEPEPQAATATAEPTKTGTPAPTEEAEDAAGTDDRTNAGTDDRSDGVTDVEVAGGDVADVADEPTEEPAPADPLALPADGTAPQAPEDPAGLGAIVTAAEQAIRDAARSPADLEAAGHWQQVAYRTLGQDTDRLEPVLAHVPEALHPAVRANVLAGASLFAMHSPDGHPDEPVEVRALPSWRIVPPPPPDELKAHYQEAEAATGVHWSYLAAVNLVETRMGRIRGTSVAGAQGPMQFMPATWGEWGQGDINDHRDAIMAAGRFLAWGGMPADVDGAIFRYNRDVRYVDAVRAYAEQIQADERAYYGYYHWQVYYFTGAENVWLAPGFDGSA